MVFKGEITNPALTKNVEKNFIEVVTKNTYLNIEYPKRVHNSQNLP